MIASHVNATIRGVTVPVPVDWQSMRTLARVAAASGLYGITRAEAMRRLVAARALGVGDATALRLDGNRWWDVAVDAAKRSEVQA
jgi:hypothetical protein